jgi:hypothetical protein
MNINLLNIILNALIGLGASTYMLYQAFRRYGFKHPARQAVYGLVGLLILYNVLIYVAVLTGWLPVPGPHEIGEMWEYSDFVRPIVSLFFLSPVAVDMVLRKYGGAR